MLTKGVPIGLLEPCRSISDDCSKNFSDTNVSIALKNYDKSRTKKKLFSDPRLRLITCRDTGTSQNHQHTANSIVKVTLITFDKSAISRDAPLQRRTWSCRRISTRLLLQSCTKHSMWRCDDLWNVVTMQDCSVSSVLAMEISQSCTHPSMWCC